MLSLSNVCNTEAKWKFHIEWNNAFTFADIDRGRERIQIKIFSSSTFMLTRARPHSTCLHTIQMQRTLAKWMLMHPFVQVSTLDSVIFHGHTQGNRMPLKTVNRYSIKLRWCHSTFFYAVCALLLKCAQPFCRAIEREPTQLNDTYWMIVFLKWITIISVYNFFRSFVRSFFACNEPNNYCVTEQCVVRFSLDSQLRCANNGQRND